MAKALTAVFVICMASVGFCTGGQPATSVAPASQPSARIAVFRIINPHKYGTMPSTIPTESLELSDKPILTEKDIVFYDAETDSLWITGETVGNIWNEEPRSSRDGIPVVVLVDGRRRFAGRLPDPRIGFSKILLRFGIYSWHLQVLSDGQKTPLDDAEFFAALKADEKLAEPAAKPLMTLQQVQTAARSMDLNYPYPFEPTTRHTEPKPVPESWKVKSITFCRDASLLVPSMNILGYHGMPRLHLVWLVQFEPPLPKIGRSDYPPHWCAVDDRTGQILPVLAPLFVRPLQLAGTDELTVGQLASVNDVHEIAAKHLSEVTSMKFLVRVEAPDPYELVWLCEGKDPAGKPARILIRDSFGTMRPPAFLVDVSRIELRHAVEAQTQPLDKHNSASKPSVENPFRHGDPS